MTTEEIQDQENQAASSGQVEREVRLQTPVAEWRYGSVWKKYNCPLCSELMKVRTLKEIGLPCSKCLFS